jgi:hypothetical protein
MQSATKEQKLTDTNILPAIVLKLLAGHSKTVTGVESRIPRACDGIQ